MQRLTLLAIASCALACSAQTPIQNARRAVETTLLDDLPSPEVAVPAAPVAFSGDGKRVLCYELLITNMDSTSVRLQRVAVYADGAAVPLLLQEAKPLSTALLHPGVSGASMAQRDRRVIRGGEQVVDLLWIELPISSPTPRFLDHTLTLQRIATGKSLTVPVAHVSIGAAIYANPTPHRDGLSPRPRSPMPPIGSVQFKKTIQPVGQLRRRRTNPVGHGSPCIL
jgi:hypothetical protein